MGVTGTSAAQVLARMADWRDLALAGVLVTPPHYVRPSQQGLLNHFTAVADASPVPLVIYDIPARTGVRVETATLLALAAHANILAVKDCSGDADHAQTIIHDARLAVLAGDDHRMFHTLCMGGAGAIAASAHVRADLFVALHRCFQANDLVAARRLWRQLWPLTQALFAEPNPAPVKAALAASLGLEATLREPMTPPSPALTQRLAQVVEALPRA